MNKQKSMKKSQKSIPPFSKIKKYCNLKKDEIDFDSSLQNLIPSSDLLNIPYEENSLLSLPPSPYSHTQEQDDTEYEEVYPIIRISSDYPKIIAISQLAYDNPDIHIPKDIRYICYDDIRYFFGAPLIPDSIIYDYVDLIKTLNDDIPPLMLIHNLDISNLGIAKNY